jgi:hypothetical protein
MHDTHAIPAHVVFYPISVMIYMLCHASPCVYHHKGMHARLVPCYYVMRVHVSCVHAPRMLCVPSPVSIIAMCYRMLCGCYPCVYRAMCVVAVGGLSLPLWLVVCPLCVCVCPSSLRGWWSSSLRVWLSLIRLCGLSLCLLSLSSGSSLRGSASSSASLSPRHLCHIHVTCVHKTHMPHSNSLTIRRLSCCACVTDPCCCSRCLCHCAPISLSCFAMHWHSALLCSALSFVSPVATLMCLAHDTRLNPALGMGPTVRVVWHVRRVTSLSHGRLLCAWCGRTASALFFSLCLSLSLPAASCASTSRCLFHNRTCRCVSASCVSVHLVSSVLCVCVPALHGFVPLPCLFVACSTPPVSPHCLHIYISGMRVDVGAAPSVVSFLVSQSQIIIDRQRVPLLLALRWGCAAPCSLPPLLHLLSLWSHAVVVQTRTRDGAVQG